MSTVYVEWSTQDCDGIPFITVHETRHSAAKSLLESFELDVNDDDDEQAEVLEARSDIMKWALDGEADLGQVGNFNFGILEQSIRS